MNRTARAEDLVGQPLPEFVLLDSAGAPFALRQNAGIRPCVLFFYIHNGTPG